ncbi:unnamed protein product [Rangifer tarandus platyrhynchus]|uniref:Uncharacterized protein n=1 Tax=Rangifer tarandus platyrhynchus TaxID=3082113 RepID=A0AC59ZGI2_RANTA
MRRYSKDAGTRAPRAPDSVQGAASRRLIRAKPTSPPILSDHRRPEGPRGWTGAWAGVNSELLTLANPADKELTEGDWPAHCIHEKADSGEAGTSKVLPQEQSASDASAVTTAGGHFLRRSWFLHWTLAWAAFNHTNLPTTEDAFSSDVVLLESPGWMTPAFSKELPALLRRFWGPSTPSGSHCWGLWGALFSQSHHLPLAGAARAGPPSACLSSIPGFAGSRH